MFLQVTPEFMLANIKCCPVKILATWIPSVCSNKSQHAFSRSWGRKGENCTFIDADNVARLQDGDVTRFGTVSHGYLAWGWVRLLSVQLLPWMQYHAPSVTMIYTLPGTLWAVPPLSCLVIVPMPKVKGDPPSSLPNISWWCVPFFKCWRVEMSADAFLHTCQRASEMYCT